MDEATLSDPERRKAVSRVVREVLARWLVPGFHPHVSSAWCINQGPCEDFADDVVELLAERLPGLPARVMSSDEAAEAIGREFNAYHAFVAVEGTYYDSQAPDGVGDPFELPFLRSELRTQMALEGLDPDADDDGDGPDEDGPSFGP